MNKKLLLSLVLVAIFLSLVGVAAWKPEDRTVGLRSVSYVSNKLVVRLHVTGFSELDDINGSVIGADRKYNGLYCYFEELHEVKCIAESMRRYQGQNMRIWFAGYVFYTKLPWVMEK